MPVVTSYVITAEPVNLHTYTHLTLPFVTYPNLHFPTLYYCQGLIKYKAETTYQIRSKRPRTETAQAETIQAETTQGRNYSGPKRPEKAVAVVEQERTCRVVDLIIWLSIFVRCEYSGLLIYLLYSWYWRSDRHATRWWILHTSVNRDKYCGFPTFQYHPLHTWCNRILDFWD